MSDKPWSNICNKVDSCALTGAGAFFCGIPNAEVMVNGPLWCYFYALRFLEHGDFTMADRFHGSQPDNSAIVYGSEKYLTEALNRILQEKQPQLLFIESSCSLSLIGDDLNGIVRKLNLPFPYVTMDSGGIVGGFAAGYVKAAKTFFDKFAEPAMPQDKTVNLIGLSDFYYNGKADTAELCRILTKAGYRVNCVPGSGSSFEQLKHIGEAALNIVSHEELGLELAQYLKQRLGTPFICAGVPYGVEGTKSWLQSIDKALPAPQLASVMEECDAMQRFLQGWNNDSRCTWGALWFDKIIVSMSGTAALCLSRAVVNEWADAGHLTIICQHANSCKDNSFADEVLYTDKDGEKITVCLEDKEKLLLLGSSSESSVLRRNGNHNLISLNMAFPANEQVLLNDVPYMGIKGSANMLERLWNAYIQDYLRK